MRRRALLCLLLAAGCAPRVAAVGGPLRHAVHVVDFGFHTVIVVEGGLVRARVAARAGEADADRLSRALADHAGAEWLEFGWGDAEVFPNARTLGDVEAWAALRAIAFPTPALVQIAPRALPPAIIYGAQDRLEVVLSQDGLDAMLAGIGAALAEPVRPVQPGFTPGSLFYPAVERYSLVRTCNTWVVDRLREGGVPLPGGILTSAATMTALRRAG